MTFSEFIGVCTVISTAVTVLSFVLKLYDRKKK